MNPIYRRNFLKFCVLGVSSAATGCSINIGGRNNGERNPTLRLFPDPEQIEGEWQMNVRVRHTSDNVASIHDVTVMAFSKKGEEVCRVDVGDFPQGGRFEATESVDCEAFPAIITATAEETPCDGANIQIVYWTGTDEQRGEEIPDGIFVWGSTFRECDEPLPPDRVIANVSTGQSTSSVSQQ